MAVASEANFTGTDMWAVGCILAELLGAL